VGSFGGCIATLQNKTQIIPCSNHIYSVGFSSWVFLKHYLL
jgi:hypothetical protein